MWILFSLLLMAGSVYAQSVTVPKVSAGPGTTATVKLRFTAGGNANNIDFFMNYDEKLIDENNATINCATTIPQLSSLNCTIDTAGNRIRGIGVNLTGGLLSSRVFASVKLPVLPGASAGSNTGTVTGNFADASGRTTSFDTNWKLEVTGAPAKPTNIRATDGSFSDKVHVTFNTVAGATVYRVFRCLTTGLTCGSPIGFPKSGSFDDKKGIPGKVYYYRVRACTPSICGKFSATNTGFSSNAPARPTLVRATDGSFSGKVRVTFNAVAGATVYRVFRCLNTGQSCGSPIGFPKTGVFDDRKGASGTIYYYRVRACTTSTCGLFSAANTGYRGTIASTEAEIGNAIPAVETDIISDAVPIPVLSSYQGRWLLILIMLGIGLMWVKRRQVFL